MDLGERLALSDLVCQKRLNEHVQDVKALQIASAVPFPNAALSAAGANEFRKEEGGCRRVVTELFGWVPWHPLRGF